MTGITELKELGSIKVNMRNLPNNRRQLIVIFITINLLNSARVANIFYVLRSLSLILSVLMSPLLRMR